jgi:alkyl sulfatase BDS1-like metallo-beta-lactamase superfamily hydrolase
VTDLPFEDRADFEDADRGLIGSLDTPDPGFAIVTP